jgi:delta 1-pyrroline-5-carboxylate dehydrogenase
MAVVSQAQASSALHESMKASAAQAFQASGARLAAIATQPATQLIQGCSQENDVLGCIDSINKIKTEQELKASQAQTV